MAVVRHRRHHHHISAAFALLFFITALGVLAGMEKLEENHEKVVQQREDEDQWVVLFRRRLSGPGSSPPTCHSRCGRCLPCRPVHVAIQPGRSIPLEYYPEAWRCKCGNKLFMP